MKKKVGQKYGMLNLANIDNLNITFGQDSSFYSVMIGMASAMKLRKTSIGQGPLLKLKAFVGRSLDKITEIKE